MFDFGLFYEWKPAHPTTWENHQDIDELCYDWDLVACSGSAHDGDEWLVFVDTIASHREPGQDDRVVAVHLVRDRATRTYTVAFATFPGIARAEGWLRTRGAGDLTRVRGLPAPDDDVTREIEERVRRDFARQDRTYSVMEHAAHLSRVVFHDRAARDPERTFLAYVEYRASSDTYAIREHSFATIDAAVRWATDYQPPDPRPAPEPPQSTAARAHSTALSATRSAEPPTRVVDLASPPRTTRKP